MTWGSAITGAAGWKSVEHAGRWGETGTPRVQRLDVLTSQVVVLQTSTIKVLRNGQITVPKDIRDAIGLRHGPTVLVRVTGQRQATITVLPPAGIAEVCGSLPPRDPNWSVAGARREYRAKMGARRRLGENGEMAVMADPDAVQG